MPARAKSLFSNDPYALFDQWFSEWKKFAKKIKIIEPTAVTLSTVTKLGNPTSRVVLLKGIDNGEFHFFTNYHSRKGQELLEHPYACLQFYWMGLGGGLGRQVRIEGKVRRLSGEQSDAYFASRARDSQIGAWASAQSEAMSSRAALEKRFKEVKKQFQGQAISRPPHWGGFALAPETIEFWIGRDNRLHDRCQYTRKGSKWTRQLLFP